MNTNTENACSYHVIPKALIPFPLLGLLDILRIPAILLEVRKGKNLR